MQVLYTQHAYRRFRRCLVLQCFMALSVCSTERRYTLCLMKALVRKEQAVGQLLPIAHMCARPVKQRRRRSRHAPFAVGQAAVPWMPSNRFARAIVPWSAVVTICFDNALPPWPTCTRQMSPFV
jgi:hypothetical protein